MSQQRKERSELKQGLHQFLMQMYTSYLQSMGMEQAKDMVCSVIEEEYAYFRSESLKNDTAKSELESKRNELVQLINSTKDYQMQAYYAEQVDAIDMAISALD